MMKGGERRREEGECRCVSLQFASLYVPTDGLCVRLQLEFIHGRYIPMTDTPVGLRGAHHNRDMTQQQQQRSQSELFAHDGPVDIGFVAPLIQQFRDDAVDLLVRIRHALVALLKMPAQVPLPLVGQAADHALVRPLLRMHHDVLLQFGGPLGEEGAVRALEAGAVLDRLLQLLEAHLLGGQRLPTLGHLELTHQCVHVLRLEVLVEVPQRREVALAGVAMGDRLLAASPAQARQRRKANLGHELVPQQRHLLLVLLVQMVMMVVVVVRMVRVMRRVGRVRRVRGQGVGAGKGRNSGHDVHDDAGGGCGTVRSVKGPP